MIDNKLPWIEKYRPSKFNDLILHEILRMKLKFMIENKNIPDLIIFGTPGIGKTTTIKILINEIYGDIYPECILELNSLDERGIKICDVLNKFCKAIISKNNPNKFIILDEADDITEKAQKIICNFMEEYKNKIKFAFICNTMDNITENIQSRCSILEFNRIHPKDITKRLAYICSTENIKYEDEALYDISLHTNGDLRSSINLLELIYSKYGNLKTKNIRNSNLFPNRLELNKFLEFCNDGKLKEAFIKISELKNNGYEGTDITNNLLNILTLDSTLKLDEKTKLEFYDIIAKTLYTMSKGLDSDLQIYACVCSLCKIGLQKNADILKIKK